MRELLEENIGTKLEIRLDCKFLGLTPKAKIDKWDYIKLKSFCPNETKYKMKKTPEWEKIFANHIPDKELIFKIYNKHTIQKLIMIIITKLKMGKGSE